MVHMNLVVVLWLWSNEPQWLLKKPLVTEGLVGDETYYVFSVFFPQFFIIVM